MTGKFSFHPGHNSALRMRLVVAEDRARLTALINSAFVVETFLDGTRTDEERLMAKGSIPVAENGDGRLLASVYMERSGARGYVGMLAVDPARQGEELGRKMVKTAEERFRQHDHSLRPHRQHGLIPCAFRPAN